MGFFDDPFGQSVRLYCETADRVGFDNSFIRRHVDIVMEGLPLAQVFLRHFLWHSGENLIIPTEGIIENDIVVRRNIIEKLDRDINESYGVVSNGQSNYENSNFRMAFGALNFQWRVVASDETDNFTAYIIDVWFINRYRFHLTAGRVSQCMHRAFSDTSGREYDMIGRRVFYYFVVPDAGNSFLMLGDQNLPFLQNLRRQYSPAPHSGRDITSLYAESRPFFNINHTSGPTGGFRADNVFRRVGLPL